MRHRAAAAEVSKSYKEGFVHKSDPTGKNWKRRCVCCRGLRSRMCVDGDSGLAPTVPDRTFRYVVVDEARQELIYYGSDPKQTLAELHLTEEPKGGLRHAVCECLTCRGAPSPRDACQRTQAPSR